MDLIDYFKSLPMEITSDILSRLQIELVLDCKSVCKNWRNIIRDPSFSKLHFNQQRLNGDSGNLSFISFSSFEGYRKDLHFQYFEYNEDHESTPIEKIRRMSLTPPFGVHTEFHGSYNGLICLCHDRFLTEKTYICNPLTREYIILPEIKMGYGVNKFGYVSSTNEFKVVRIMFERDTKDMVLEVEVHVYTLGSGCGWRNLGKFNFETEVQWEDGVFVNGTLYWLDYVLKKIIPFNLAEETFCEILSLPLPSDHRSMDESSRLGVLDGCLSFTVIGDLDEEDCWWNTWLLKKKNGNYDMRGKHSSMGWSQEFRVHGGEPFAITKSYNALSYCCHGHCIWIQDPKGSHEKVIRRFDDIFLGIFPHKNTLVSLKELGEEDTKIMEPVEIAETKSFN